MPREDEAWYEINPLLRWCDEYEIHGPVEVDTVDVIGGWGSGVYSRTGWEVTGVYQPDWADHPIDFDAGYFDTPQRAAEVKRQIVRMARKVHFEYDQVPPGILPQ